MPLKTLYELLSLYEADRHRSPDLVPNHPSPEDLTPLRQRIDALDRVILLLLNERAVYANAIGRIKKKLSLPVYVPAREEEVLRNVTTSNRGPLDDAAVRRLFERVIDETRSLERHIYHDAHDPATPGHHEPTPPQTELARVLPGPQGAGRSETSTHDCP